MKKLIYFTLLLALPVALTGQTRMGGQGLYNKAKMHEINTALENLTTIVEGSYKKVKRSFMPLSKPLNNVTVEELGGLVYKLNGYATNSMTGIPLVPALQHIFDTVKNDYKTIVSHDNHLFTEQTKKLSTDTPNAKQFIQGLLYQIITGFKLPQFIPLSPIYDKSGNMMYIQGEVTPATSGIAPMVPTR